jgi:hypothetical protein
VKLKRRAAASKARSASRDGGRCAGIYAEDLARATVRMSLSYPTMADKSFAGFLP